VATVAALVLYVVARAAEVEDWWNGWVYRLDVALLALFVIYRIAKELVTPVRPEDSAREVTVADLAERLDAIQRDLQAERRDAP
ncbi:MAG TPA: hypothetical protein VFU93_05800, partial [Acidimicrobiales bacterium]|nr:hypothetical protein [Acidimicrobiales bacterium]